jgi:glyoxylase-like metal-dependent hydrolase (beta-lactamase superfamily II)
MPEIPMSTDASTYEVVIVKYGTRTTMRSDVFLNYHLYHEPDGPIGMDYFFWVLRNDLRTIVVDTGFSPEGGASRGRTQVAPVPSLLRALGVDPEAVVTVVLTHAHYDHAGNLGLFPQSPVVVAESEVDFWESRYAERALFRHSMDVDNIEQLRKIRAEGRLELIRGSSIVAPGVEVIEVGGHTPGQCLVKVDTPDGPVLLASDAVHYYEELERDMLFSSVADVVAMYRAFDTVKTMVDAGAVKHLVAGHDPITLGRFAPIADDLRDMAATIGAPHG